MTNGAKLDVDRLLAAINQLGLGTGDLHRLRKALADEFPEILWTIGRICIDAEVITESYEL